MGTRIWAIQVKNGCTNFQHLSLSLFLFYFFFLFFRGGGVLSSPNSVPVSLSPGIKTLYFFVFGASYERDTTAKRV